MKEQIKDIIRNNANGAYPLADIAAAEILALFSVSLSEAKECVIPNIGIDKICFKCGIHISEHNYPNN